MKILCLHIYNFNNLNMQKSMIQYNKYEFFFYFSTSLLLLSLLLSLSLFLRLSGLRRSFNASNTRPIMAIGNFTEIVISFKNGINV